MAEIENLRLRIFQTVDRLLEQSWLWQADAMAFLNDFSLLLYVLALSGADDNVSFGKALRKTDQQRLVGSILMKYPNLKELDYEFGRELKTISDDTWRELMECLTEFSLEKESQKYAGEIFDYTLQSMYIKEKISNFITPQSLADMMAEMLDPKPGERVIDPVCGCGRLLTAAAARCQECQYIGNDIDGKIKVTAFFHTAIHGLKDITFYQKDFLKEAWKEEGDLILANPPYNEQINHTIDFIKKIMDALKDGGRCGVLLPEGFLNNSVSADVIGARRFLLENYSLEAVISLPKKMYSPYMISKSSLILLKKKIVSSKHLTFFSSVPEYQGPEHQISDEVYRPDMGKIAKAWKLWKQGQHMGHDVGEGGIFQAASLKEIKKNGFIFAADFYQKSEIKYTQLQKDKVWDSINAGQKALQCFVSDYFGEDSAT